MPSAQVRRLPATAVAPLASPVALRPAVLPSPVVARVRTGAVSERQRSTFAEARAALLRLGR